MNNGRSVKNKAERIPQPSFISNPLNVTLFPYLSEGVTATVRL